MRPATERRLGVVEFGQALIETEDLDPVYVALAGAALPKDQLKRWLLAYWCYYHAGVASRLSEERGAGFWRAMREADRLRWPRGRERRHFRGGTCDSGLSYLAARYPAPEMAVTELQSLGPQPTFGAVAGAVREWPFFGPWIAFKVADMLERLCLLDVRFSVEDVELYEEPRKGAELARAELGVADTETNPLRAACVALEACLRLPAPPSYNRLVGIQEVETVLCKWKGHLAGHYPVGLDTKEIREALGKFNWGDTARRFSNALPKGDRYEAGRDGGGQRS